MKYKKTREVQRTEEYVYKVTCDLCNAEIRDECGNISRVKIKHATGYSYADCGNIVTKSYDVCGKCFEEKLVPWMEQQGAKPSSEEHDW